MKEILEILIFLDIFLVEKLLFSEFEVLLVQKFAKSKSVGKKTKTTMKNSIFHL